MKKKLLALVLVVVGMTAAAGPQPPVITMKGIEAAVKMPAKVKVAIEPKVTKLDARLQQIAAFHETYRTADAETRAKLHKDALEIHEECMRLLEEITAQMTPEQRQAFMAYLHEQLKTSGIDPSHFPNHKHGE